MKKALSIALMVICTAASAAVQTNWVYVVSNIYIRTSEVRYVTNRVQNTHYNYYYTNNVTTITNIWTVNHTTNINYEVIFDNFGPWIEAASNQANRAASSATAASGFASEASGYATSAGSYRSSAQTYAGNASASAAAAQRAADAGLSNINARIAWFDAHAGETITMVTTNISMALDPAVNFPHTTASGTTYENIRYYPVGNENGRICANPATYGPATAFCVSVLLNRTGQNFGVPFYFDFGYMDSDAAGLRVHYVTRTKELKLCTLSTSANKLGLPRDFYWQDGHYFAVFDFYDSATNWETRITYRSNNSFTYPDNVLGGNNDSGQTWGYGDSWMSQYAVEGTTRPAVANFKTEKDSYLSNTTPLWISETPTSEQQQTIDWLNTFPHQ